MIQFLAPAAFLAALTLLIPVVVHLLRRKPPKTLKVGSIQFLRPTKSKKLRRYSLHEILQLILRLLIFALLVLLLAAPVWQPSHIGASNKDSGWVFVSREALAQRPAAASRLLDSLIAAGYHARLLAPGFPIYSTGDETGAAHTRQNLWSLANEAAALVPPDLPVRFIVPNRLASFRGERPIMREHVTWQIIASQDTNYWISEIQQVTRDSIRIVAGISSPQETYFDPSLHRFPSDRRTLITGSGIPVEIVRQDGQGVYDFRLSVSDAIPQDDVFRFAPPPSRQVCSILFDEAHAEDARYLELAFEAIMEVAPKWIELQMNPIANRPTTNDSPFRCFWLSQQPVPETIRQRARDGAFVFTSASSHEYESIKSWAALDRPDNFIINRRIAAKGIGIPLWRDGFGEPLLEFEPAGSGGILHFYSRLHPQWNNLVLTETFPAWLAKFLSDDFISDFAAQPGDMTSDLRKISHDQLVTATSPREVETDEKPAREKLHLYLWFAAFILFVLERWNATRHD